MKTGVMLARRQAVLHEQHRVVEIHRRVEGLGGRVVVDHPDQFAARAVRQRLVRHCDGDGLVAGQPGHHGGADITGGSTA